MDATTEASATEASATEASTADPAAAAAELEQQIARLRSGIDALDGDIIRLIQRRLEVSREVQRVRTSSGGRRLQHGRELVVVNRYASELGAPGTAVAMAILELARGPLSA